ncbi:hypothetical protein Tsubulata_031531 [Turnera subulata]|uniref:Uncharacterized protein n=1 Tax=Turnera subulata TaxID=218843 RepID=A0A9Q0FCW8_9ROSI|nr:hypothetical protein Tsubulata_031531 [Turnera subulata]
MQWAAGFSTFWYPGGAIGTRAALLPWHVFNNNNHLFFDWKYVLINISTPVLLS